VQATNGDFYGTTYEGGANDWGTVFKVTRAGTLTTLHNFCSEAKCTDGGQPQAGLIQAINGNLYGTTTIGGPNGGGTIFMITPSGTLKTLYGFCAQSNCADGKSPEAGLIQATSGDFYGTTPSGGANSGGTVFKVTPGGALTTLYSFCSQNAGQPCSDGEEPFGELVQAINGNLYGTTYVGGGGGEGTIFSITPSGALTTLYSFCSPSGCTAGYQPLSGLVQATDGNLYGTASGTNSGGGAVFEINQSGAVSALYSFPCCASPFAALVQATDGNFYGTTHSGGALNYGTVFSLSVGLGPFVKAQPSAAKVSGVVEILGTNLTGATGVTFNGIPAVFNVASSSLITTNVPAGATTGTVQVVTPSATLSSNVPFQVLP
jgi:uncharacterized repeat protein (TIGR03803 family)